MGAGSQREEIEEILGARATALDVDSRADVDVFADAVERSCSVAPVGSSGSRRGDTG